ncbi:MAG TPA: hypothetical protein VFJ57_13125 [Solirubrobacterales bacterium]|nr:hypothetical protein [Solirubrobacterales bacterium]
MTLVDDATPYYISFDGRRDESSGDAPTFGFELNILLSGKYEPVPAPSGPPPDLSGPQTLLTANAIKLKKRQVTFRFRASEPGSRFRCQLDNRPLAACDPPKTYSHLGYGKHVFRVAAVDSAGNTDPTAAVARFAIPKPKPRHRSAH